MDNREETIPARRRLLQIARLTRRRSRVQARHCTGQCQSESALRARQRHTRNRLRQSTYHRRASRPPSMALSRSKTAQSHAYLSTHFAHGQPDGDPRNDFDTRGMTRNYSHPAQVVAFTNSRRFSDIHQRYVRFRLVAEVMHGRRSRGKFATNTCDHCQKKTRVYTYRVYSMSLQTRRNRTRHQASQQRLTILNCAGVGLEGRLYPFTSAFLWVTKLKRTEAN